MWVGYFCNAHFNRCAIQMTKTCRHHSLLWKKGEAAAYQKMKISYSDTAVLMVYSSSEYSTIVGSSVSLLCEALIKTCAVQTLKTSRPHPVCWIKWRHPSHLRKKTSVSHLATTVLKGNPSCEYKNIVGKFCYESPIKRWTIQLFRAPKPHSLWWINWRPMSLRK